MRDILACLMNIKVARIAGEEKVRSVMVDKVREIPKAQVMDDLVSHVEQI